MRLVGFGNFSVTRRKASTGRNPRTGEPMQIKASSTAQVPPGQGPQGRGARNCRDRQAGSTPRSRSLKGAPTRAWARSSVVEHTLHTGGVAGSIPAAPTMPQRSRSGDRRAGVIHAASLLQIARLEARHALQFAPVAE